MGFYAWAKGVGEPGGEASEKPAKQPDRAEKWRKEGNKSAERKRGHDFPRVINFQSQVARWCSLKPVFPLAVRQSLLTFSILFSAPMSLTSRCVVTFRAVSTYLWRTANQVQTFFHAITTVPAAVAVGVRLRGASSPSAAAKRPLDSFNN